MVNKCKSYGGPYDQTHHHQLAVQGITGDHGGSPRKSSESNVHSVHNCFACSETHYKA